MKWYHYRNIQTKELIWWTKRDKNGNCFEIRKNQCSKVLQLFVNEIFKENFVSLTDAQNAVNQLQAF